MNAQKTHDLLERDKAVITSGQHLLYFPLAVDRVDGEIVTDIDGNRYIDFLSSASSLNLGGSHPLLMQAVRHQMEKCIQYCTCYTMNQPMVEYAERLTSVYPGRSPSKVFSPTADPTPVMPQSVLPAPTPDGKKSSVF